MNNRNESINNRNISNISNVHHKELNTNKSNNRKIAIILPAEFNRIMSKEIFGKRLKQ